MIAILSLLLINTQAAAFTINSFPIKTLSSNIKYKMSANNVNYQTTKNSDFNNYKRYNENKFNPTTVIQGGGSLKTWCFKSPTVEQVQVKISSEGRPLDTDIELWQGPQNTPSKMRVYTENGFIRPFHTVIETPRGPNTIAISNIGQLEFPILVNVKDNNIIQPSQECLSSFYTIQGGALCTYPFTPIVGSVQIMLRTDGRPLNARIELLQGPNNNKQVIELYTDDGCDRPFFCVLETPGAGNVIRIVNTSPIEFPLVASVSPNYINPNA